MKEKKKEKDIGYDSRITDTYGKISEVLDSGKTTKESKKKEK